MYIDTFGWGETENSKGDKMELKICRTDEEIIKEMEKLEERRTKVWESIDDMKDKNFPDSFIRDAEMLLHRITAKREVYHWLMMK